jgi:outer membrane protein assembly factor BamB
LRRKFLLAVLVVQLTVASARADFTFIHISDIHVGAGENAATDAKMFAEIVALDPKPAFLVNTGDVCEHGTQAQYDLLHETLKSLGDTKMYCAPGNHDIRWNPRGKEGYVKGVGQPLYQSWDYENVHFVTLDSTVLLEHWGHISQDQLDWLKADLEKVGPDKPVVIGFHHGVGRGGEVYVDNEQALFDVVKPYNVVLWLQGHGHSDVEWNINGRPATMVAGLYQGSYDIIRVTADEMKITKRFIPKPKKKKGEELLKDKTPEEIPPKVRDVLTIPLKTLQPPEWSATAEPKAFDIEISATPPAGATVTVQIPTTQMAVAGEHLITINAELPDKTTYQKHVPVKMPGPIKEPAWSTNIHGAVQSRLVRSAELLYISSMAGDLVALNPTDGKEKFRAKTGGPIFCEPAVQDGTVYFGSADHFVYAVDAGTGKEKWKTETGAGIFAGPAVAKGVVCIGSSDTKIYGLDASTGSQIWTAQGANMFQTKTATDGERFFVGGWDNHFRCIDAGNGKVLWDLELGRKTAAKDFSPFAPAITAPAVGDGKVFVSTNDGILHALKIESGEELWKIDWKNMGYSSPLYRDGRVYCALSDQGRIFCVDANTGNFRWIAETRMVIYDSSFCFGGGNVFIGNVNGTVNAINADSGRFVYQYRMTPGHLLGSPIADDKFVYVGNMAGRVIALPLNPPPPAPK